MGVLTLPSAVPSLNIGGRVFTDLANLLILNCYAVGTTTTNGTFRKPNASAGYQVPASKSFKVCAMEYFACYTAAANQQTCYLLYADNDVGFNSSTAFTNGVILGGSGLVGAFGSLSNVTDACKQFAADFTVPTGKYPAFVVNTSSISQMVVKLYGYEV